MANQLHPTAVLDKRKGMVILEAGVYVGPGAVIVGPVHLRAGVQVHAGAVVGSPPQECSATRVDWERSVVIGAGTVIREHAVINRGKVDGQGTRIGEDCQILAGAHISGDCVLGADVTIPTHGVVDSGCTLRAGSITSPSSNIT